VDDEPGLRLLMTAILEREGYRVQLAENGAMALERLSKAPLPHLIVLDLEMPEVNGVAFRTIQLQSTELARIPVVVCTSEDATRYREQFLGCPRVTKPFRIEAFVAAVRSALHRKLA
jgi:CheY-like chemotaxis protein